MSAHTPRVDDEARHTELGHARSHLRKAARPGAKASAHLLPCRSQARHNPSHPCAEAPLEGHRSRERWATDSRNLLCPLRAQLDGRRPPACNRHTARNAGPRESEIDNPIRNDLLGPAAEPHSTSALRNT